MFQSPGIRVGRIFGIPILIQPSFFAFFALSAWVIRSVIVEATDDHSVWVTVAAAMTGILIFASMLFHELGHALAARRFNIHTSQITMHLLGGIAHLRSEMKSPREEFWIAIAGPAVSFALAFVFGVPLLNGVISASPILSVCLQSLASINLVFAVFNLVLIGFPLDGGHVLRAVIWKVTGNYLLATKIASRFGIAIGCCVFVLGVLRIVFGDFFGITYILLGGYLIRLAKVSYQGAAYSHTFKTFTVRDMMRPIQAVVPSHISIRDVVRHFVTQLHADQFPVVRGAELLGFISAEDIAALDRDRWQETSAESLARPYPKQVFVNAGASMLVGYNKLSRSGFSMLPVLDGHQLCGFLFWRDVQMRLEKSSRIIDTDGLKSAVPFPLR